jgi:hypothetical protein
MANPDSNGSVVAQDADSTERQGEQWTFRGRLSQGLFATSSLTALRASLFPTVALSMPQP